MYRRGVQVSRAPDDITRARTKLVRAQFTQWDVHDRRSASLNARANNILAPTLSIIPLRMIWSVFTTPLTFPDYGCKLPAVLMRPCAMARRRRAGEVTGCRSGRGILEGRIPMGSGPRRFALLLAALVSAWSGTARAQTRGSAARDQVSRSTTIHLLAGSHIRVTSLKYFRQPITGAYQDVARDSLSFEESKWLYTIPLRDITELEVELDGRRHTKDGALIGGVLGVAITLMVALKNQPDAFNSNISPKAIDTSYFVEWFELPLGLAVGAGVGALIGHSIYSRSWFEVPLRGKEPPTP